MFHHIFKPLKFRQKYSAAYHIFNSVLCVWKYDETLCSLFTCTSNISSDFSPDMEIDLYSLKCAICRRVWESFQYLHPAVHWKEQTRSGSLHTKRRLMPVADQTWVELTEKQ